MNSKTFANWYIILSAIAFILFIFFKTHAQIISMNTAIQIPKGQETNALDFLTSDEKLNLILNKLYNLSEQCKK